MDYKFIGDCHHIAIALNRKYKLPIVFFYGEREDYQAHGCDEDCDAGCDTLVDEDVVEDVEYIMIHCGVVDNDVFRDFSGLNSSLDESLAEYIQVNQAYDHTEIFIFESEENSEFNRLVNLCGSRICEDRVQYFMGRV